MNLEERITNAVMEKLTDGTVEELVKKNVESAINKSLNDLSMWILRRCWRYKSR